MAKTNSLGMEMALNVPNDLWIWTAHPLWQQSAHATL